MDDDIFCDEKAFRSSQDGADHPDPHDALPSGARFSHRMSTTKRKSTDQDELDDSVADKDSTESGNEDNEINIFCDENRTSQDGADHPDPHDALPSVPAPAETAPIADDDICNQRHQRSSRTCSPYKAEAEEAAASDANGGDGKGHDSVQVARGARRGTRDRQSAASPDRRPLQPKADTPHEALPVKTDMPHEALDSADVADSTQEDKGGGEAQLGAKDESKEKRKESSREESREESKKESKEESREADQDTENVQSHDETAPGSVGDATGGGSGKKGKKSVAKPPGKTKDEDTGAPDDAAAAEKTCALHIAKAVVDADVKIAAAKIPVANKLASRTSSRKRQGTWRVVQSATAGPSGGDAALSKPLSQPDASSPLHLADTPAAEAGLKNELEAADLDGAGGSRRPARRVSAPSGGNAGSSRDLLTAAERGGVSGSKTGKRKSANGKSDESVQGESGQAAREDTQIGPSKDGKDDLNASSQAEVEEASAEGRMDTEHAAKSQRKGKRKRAKDDVLDDTKDEQAMHTHAHAGACMDDMGGLDLAGAPSQLADLANSDKEHGDTREEEDGVAPKRPNKRARSGVAQRTPTKPKPSATVAGEKTPVEEEVEDDALDSDAALPAAREGVTDTAVGKPCDDREEGENDWMHDEGEDDREGDGEGNGDGEEDGGEEGGRSKKRKGVFKDTDDEQDKSETCDDKGTDTEDMPWGVMPAHDPNRPVCGMCAYTCTCSVCLQRVRCVGFALHLYSCEYTDILKHCGCICWVDNPDRLVCVQIRMYA